MSDFRPHARKAPRATLSIRDLTVEFARRGSVLRSVNGVSLEVWPGEIVGVIGESGSGKTMTALSVMRLLPYGAKVAGIIELAGRDILRISEAEMRAVRGDRVSLIPQDAMQALNPTMRVGRQVGEPYEIHRSMPVRIAATLVSDLFRTVKITDPEIRAKEYPHQFSGGMQQRAMIATGLALDPELIIADEPTTALDVTVQARILRLLREIRDERGSAILFITHELGIVAELCDWVYVMNRGRVVEDGPVKRIFQAPRADYTRMLLEATPSIHRRRAR